MMFRWIELIAPGKTPLSSAFACSALQRTMPPRGPQSVFVVEDVTKSACGTGLGMTFAATRPDTCAMSTMKYAPTDFAMLAIRS